MTNKPGIRNHVPPAKFSRKDPFPGIPYEEDHPPVSIFTIIGWSLVGLLIWAAVLSPLWLQ